MTTIAIHGMFGLPEEWKFFPSTQPINLWATPPQPFEIWADSFNQEHSGSILVGYSLGGRLALHAIKEAPHRWKGAVIISAHPGLQTAEEKEKRLIADSLWADKLESLVWTDFFCEWNAQKPLASSPVRIPSEASFDKHTLVKALRTWSLGNQENLVKPIQTLEIPILWITGERDQKFTEIASKLHFKHSLSKHVVIPNSGHRVPWEQQEAFLSYFYQWQNLLFSNKSKVYHTVK